MDDLQAALADIPGLEHCAPPPLAGGPAPAPPGPPPAPPPTYGAVRRIDDRDIRDMAPWLLPRLHARYPQVNTRNYGGWLAGLAGNTEVCLVRNAAAAGMAAIVYDPCNPVAQCKVVWVYVKDSQTHAGLALFVHFRQWAKLFKCDRITWDTPSGLIAVEPGSIDVPNEMLKGPFPQICVYNKRVVIV